ncbi:MAG: ankyrin repeat domain-containing protein [Pirellulaceae bacterium]|nr:ankyrin repeat domain-containing protein [Pirellulaceae bacterium]
MKSLLITAIAALLLVGCGKSDGIWVAAEEGDVEAVKGYLAIDVNVDARDEVYAGTPLHFAAFRGRKEVAELLINEGADVNAKNQADATPLDKAIEKNRDETVSLLRKHGGKTGEELKGGEPVVEATQPEPPTVKAPDILIHEAVAEGNIEAVKQHLNAGTDVNAKDEDSWTHLHFAASDGHKEVVELFIAKGADVNVKSKFDETPLDLAIINNETETADLLRKHGGKTSDWFKAGESIHSAARAGHIEAVKQHLAKGTDVNAKWKRNGWTPLCEAAKEGHKEIAELLIKEGADVNAIIFYGRNQEKTPLDLAIQHKKTETADLLRKHGGKRVKN